MTNNMGRVRVFSCFAVTGNGNGLAGFALKKSGDSKTALSKVKNRAGTKVIYIERYNDHTGTNYKIFYFVKQFWFEMFQ